MAGLLGFLGLGKRKAPAPDMPAAAAPSGQRDPELFGLVEAALEDIRPALQADGGDLELVNARPDGVVEVHLTGSCVGCPMSQMTLKQGIEQFLLATVPGVRSVEAV